MEKETGLREDITTIKLSTIAEWLCQLEEGAVLTQSDFVVSRVAAGYLLKIAFDHESSE